MVSDQKKNSVIIKLVINACKRRSTDSSNKELIIDKEKQKR